MSSDRKIARLLIGCPQGLTLEQMLQQVRAAYVQGVEEGTIEWGGPLFAPERCADVGWFDIRFTDNLPQQQCKPECPSQCKLYMTATVPCDLHGYSHGCNCNIPEDPPTTPELMLTQRKRPDSR